MLHSLYLCECKVDFDGEDFRLLVIFGEGGDGIAEKKTCK